MSVIYTAAADRVLVEKQMLKTAQSKDSKLPSKTLRSMMTEDLEPGSAQYVSQAWSQMLTQGMHCCSLQSIKRVL
jgi:hypothetical protein